MQTRRIFLENLEPRYLLSGSGWSAGQISADWFRSFAADYGDPAASGAPQAALERSWIVQLSETALEQLPQVANVPTLLACHGLPVRAVRGLGMAGQIVMESASSDSAAVYSSLMSSPLIAHASPNGTMQAQADPPERNPPNDPQFGDQIFFDQASDLDIDAPEAWSLTTGSSSVVIAVIDSGIDYNHPDLAANVWSNNAEKNGQPNVDDDGNGFTDDAFGYDFANGDSDPFDDNGHGTNVAGIIGARGNNNLGVAGVNWSSKILSVKYLNQDNVGTRDNAVAAINYVTALRQRGINIKAINASWGDYGGFYQPLFDAIQAAGDAGILFVAAAGNGNSLGRGIDLDRERTPFYPASYELENIITVGAYAPDGTAASFSNVGSRSVDLLAPGVGVLTTERGGVYAARNGTSFAAPFVAGTVGLIGASKPNTPISEVRDAILAGIDVRTALSSIVATSGLLNAHRALTAPTFAPRASVSPIAPRTEPGVFEVEVTYASSEELNLQSIVGQEILIQRQGFRGDAVIAPLAPDGIDVIDAHQVKARYQVEVSDATRNGTYQVRLRGNRLRDVNGLAAAERGLRDFTVNIADADVILVNTKSDTADADLGDGIAADSTGKASLRAAIQHANATAGTQTILLPDGFYAITQGGSTAPGEDFAVRGDFDITSDVRIVGSGSRFNNISAQRRDRVFDVHPLASLTLENVRVVAGDEDFGAGIRNQGFLDVIGSFVNMHRAGIAGGGIANMRGGTASIVRSSFERNTTLDQLTPLGGAGIYNDGNLTIDSSTLSANVSAAGFTTLGGGGGVFNASHGVLLVVNSTISGNSAARGKGGGVYNVGVATLRHATVVDNVGVRAGGVFNETNEPTAVELQNTVVARSIGALNDADGPMQGLGNFVGLASIETYNLLIPQDNFQGNIVGEPGEPLDPLLGPLADNGGPTLTHLPFPTSRLIGFSRLDNAVVVDQAGQSRVASAFDTSADTGALERFNSVFNGRIFTDADGDEVFDSNETGLAGVTVFVDSNRNSLLDAGETSAVTAADDPSTPLTIETGTYTLVAPQGFQQIAVLPLAGYRPTNFRALSSSAAPTITVLADSLRGAGGKLFTQPFHPAIDSDGTVAFSAVSEAGPIAYFIGNGGTFDQINVGGNFGEHYDSHLEGGLLAFASEGGANSLLPSGVYVREADGMVRTIANSATQVPSGTGTFSGYRFVGPRVSEGIVLFHTELPGVTPAGGVYAGSNQQDLIKLVDTVAPFGGFSNFRDADFDGYNYGFYVGGESIRFRSNSSGIVGVAGNGIPMPPDFAGRFDFTRGPVALSVSDETIYASAHGSEGEWGIYFGGFNGGLLNFIADLNTTVPRGVGTFQAFGNAQSLELATDRKNVVFIARGSNGLEGLYCWADGALRKVLDNTDSIAGSRIVEFDIGSDAISENRIAFAARLEDGREVVAVAEIPFISQQTSNLFRGQQVNNLNFGLQPQPGRLAGTVFQDDDADTLPDATDPRLENWKVFLDQNDNQQHDVGEFSTLTDEQGNYVFENLPASQTYLVRLEVQGSFQRIFPANSDDGKWVVNLGAGESREELDFAAVPSGGSGGVGTQSVLQGRVYSDNNGSKAFDRGEGRGGWTVFLDANRNGFLDTGERRTLTAGDNPNTPADETGNYAFADLAASSYELRVLIPSDSEQVTPQSNRLQQRLPVSTLTNPTHLALGDLNNDGRADLVITSGQQNAARILLNNGAGVFLQSKTIDLRRNDSEGPNPTAVAIGDLDGRFGNDIVVANFYTDAALSVLLNNNGATGVPFGAVRREAVGPGVTYGRTQALALADFDGDDRMDIATANQNDTHSVFIYFNRPAAPGDFVHAQTLNTGEAFAIAAIHLNDDNGDGFWNDNDAIDLAVANIDDGRITLLRNNGQGVFSSAGFVLVGSRPASIAVGDFDGRRGPDLAVANYDSKNVSILLSTGAGFAFQSVVQVSAPVGASSIVAGDIDADADVDLIVAAGRIGSEGGVSILRNRGNGTFGAAESQGVGDLGRIESFNAAVGSVDTDGTPDIVVTNGFESNYSVLTNQILSTGSHNVQLLTGLETVSGLDFLVRQLASRTPTAIDLVNARDTGSSAIDNLTRFDNSNSANRLTFRVSGTVPGATVKVYAKNANGQRYFVGSAVATSTTTLITTLGTRDLADGVREFTARQTEPGKANSVPSIGLRVRIDTAPPIAPGRPDLVGASDDGVRRDDNRTSLSVLTFFGNATVGTTVRLFRNGVQVASGSSNSQGKYFLTASGFAPGVYSMTATATDAAGNVSPVSNVLSVTVFAPTAPALSSALTQPDESDELDAYFAAIGSEALLS